METGKNMADIWHEKVNIRFGNVDRSDRLTLWAIFNFFQEASISHAADLGVGRDVFKSTGKAWILSRLSLVIDRRPGHGETIQIGTWPRKWDRLFALRDYEILDESGNAAVRGRGGWLILDIEKRKPLRVQPFLDSLPANEGINALPEAGTSQCPPGLEQRSLLTKKMERAALYSDIDYYGHVNNARYIQWIQDATDMELLTNTGRARLDINYLSEVMPGETIDILSAPLEEARPIFAYEGRRPGSGQAVFRAELRMEEILS